MRAANEVANALLQYEVETATQDEYLEAIKKVNSVHADWTLLKNEIPHEEALYLIQYKDGDIETLYLEEDDMLYLQGMEVYVQHTFVLDQIHSWMPVSDLPQPPAIPKTPRKQTYTTQVA